MDVLRGTEEDSGAVEGDSGGAFFGRVHTTGSPAALDFQVGPMEVD